MSLQIMTRTEALRLQESQHASLQREFSELEKLTLVLQDNLIREKAEHGGVSQETSDFSVDEDQKLVTVVDKDRLQLEKQMGDLRFAYEALQEQLRIVKAENEELQAWQAETKRPIIHQAHPVFPIMKPHATGSVRNRSSKTAALVSEKSSVVDIKSSSTPSSSSTLESEGLPSLPRSRRILTRPILLWMILRVMLCLSALYWLMITPPFQSSSRSYAHPGYENEAASNNHHHHNHHHNHHVHHVHRKLIHHVSISYTRAADGFEDDSFSSVPPQSHQQVEILLQQAPHRFGFIHSLGRQINRLRRHIATHLPT